MLVSQRGRQTLRRQLYHPVSGSVSSRPEDYQRLWANDGIESELARFVANMTEYSPRKRNG
jgi:hypothetical protein